MQLPPSSALAGYRVTVMVVSRGACSTRADSTRAINAKILRPVPLAETVHGFVRTRSAPHRGGPHAASAVVVRMDLADFFSSIPAGRVFGVFATLGYPEAVARLLTGLCTAATPTDVLAALPRTPNPAALHARRQLIQKVGVRHLPQGAPTSPALANLCARRLNARLGAIAESWRARYSRYADDLFFFSFTAPVNREGVEAFVRLVAECARFREQLTGRVAHVAHLNPRWGEKLRAKLEKVWPA